MKAKSIENSIDFKAENKIELFPCTQSTQAGKCFAIYLSSHRVRIWHKAVLLRGSWINRDSCLAVAKILDLDDSSLLGHLRQQAVNLVQQAGKDLRDAPIPRPRYHSMQTQPPGTNARLLARRCCCTRSDAINKCPHSFFFSKNNTKMESESPTLNLEN